MSPRTGRPKGDNPIEKPLAVRIDAETEKKLEAYCAENGISKGEAVRKGIHLLLAQK